MLFFIRSTPRTGSRDGERKSRRHSSGVPASPPTKMKLGSSLPATEEEGNR